MSGTLSGVPGSIEGVIAHPERVEKMRKLIEFTQPVLYYFSILTTSTGNQDLDNRLSNIRDGVVTSLDLSDLAAIRLMLEAYKGDFSFVDGYIFPFSEYQSHPSNYKSYKVNGVDYVFASIDDFETDNSKPNSLNSVMVSDWAKQFQEFFDSIQYPHYDT